MDNSRNAFWEYSNEDRLDALLDGGPHMDDHTEVQRRQYRHDTDKPCNKRRDRLAAEKDN
jgi:hypothetical protein